MQGEVFCYHQCHARQTAKHDKCTPIASERLRTADRTNSGRTGYPTSGFRKSGIYNYLRLDTQVHRSTGHGFLFYCENDGSKEKPQYHGNQNTVSGV
ncbi:Os01g0712750 [Oryza sativa Japonica Group]|uniref:Os01g0712750 protein n=1 Tax=Oryza sativa subsp. japonica TaxID=39947 RepID=A0A0P0V7D4_ORYSJ|nr:Os01g0712750 [Oryza sativa Japonica Group]